MENELASAEINFGKELGKSALAAAAVTAGAVVGMYAGLLIVGKIGRTRNNWKARTAGTSEK